MTPHSNTAIGVNQKNMSFSLFHLWDHPLTWQDSQLGAVLPLGEHLATSGDICVVPAGERVDTTDWQVSGISHLLVGAEPLRMQSTARHPPQCHLTPSVHHADADKSCRRLHSWLVGLLVTVRHGVSWTTVVSGSRVWGLSWCQLTGFWNL